jgi:ABC-2 type transport system permease protein
MSVSRVGAARRALPTVSVAPEVDARRGRPTGGVTRWARQVVALSRVEITLFVREPFAMFFSLAFPLVLLLFVGSVGARTEVVTVVRFIDTYMASMVGMTAANVGIMGLAIHVAENRSRGALKRYRLSPLHPSAFFTAQWITAALTLAVSLVGLTVVTFSLYGPTDATRWGAFLAVGVLALYVAVSWGMLLGGLPLPLRSVQVISAAVFFLMFFSSGAALPRQAFPQWLQSITDWNPLAQLNDLLVHFYSGAYDANWLSIGVLIVTSLVINLITIKTFNWEGQS